MWTNTYHEHDPLTQAAILIITNTRVYAKLRIENPW